MINKRKVIETAFIITLVIVVLAVVLTTVATIYEQKTALATLGNEIDEIDALVDELHDEVNKLAEVTIDMMQKEAEVKYVYVPEYVYVPAPEPTPTEQSYVNLTDYDSLTYPDLLLFLENDQTNEQEYIEGAFECVHFATRLCHNARVAGWKCDVVFINYCGNESNHAVVCFQTDIGLVYIEPQNDLPIRDTMHYQGLAQSIRRSIIQPSVRGNS